MTRKWKLSLYGRTRSFGSAESLQLAYWRLSGTDRNYSVMWYQRRSNIKGFIKKAFDPKINWKNK